MSYRDLERRRDPVEMQLIRHEGSIIRLRSYLRPPDQPWRAPLEFKMAHCHKKNRLHGSRVSNWSRKALKWTVELFYKANMHSRE